LKAIKEIPAIMLFAGIAIILGYITIIPKDEFVFDTMHPNFFLGSGGALILLSFMALAIRNWKKILTWVLSRSKPETVSKKTIKKCDRALKNAQMKNYQNKKGNLTGIDFQMFI
jgi:hypothetical protein